jgi:hypothetical protein
MRIIVLVWSKTLQEAGAGSILLFESPGRIPESALFLLAEICLRF